MKLRYEINGERIRAWVNDDCFWTTNDDGEGLFFVDLPKNSRRQYIGHCDFSVRGLTDKSKKAKMRKVIFGDD